MFQFKEEINYENFFRVSKSFVRDGRWAVLPKASKAIFLPIACYANERGVSFPGTETIAALSGISVDTVTMGLKGLSTVSGLIERIEKFVTNHGKRANRYYVHLPSKEKGASFPVYRSIVDGGNWRMLSRSGQALYIAIRTFAFYAEDGFILEEYAQRMNELCEAEPDVLCEYAGLHIKSFDSAVESLETCELIEVIHNNQIKVAIRPQKRFKTEFLNNQLEKIRSKESF